MNNVPETSQLLTNEDDKEIMEEMKLEKPPIINEIDDFAISTAFGWRERHRIIMSEGSFKTGFEQLDKKIKFLRGENTVILGRSHHGKSVFLYNLLVNALMENDNTRCLFFSFENSVINVMSKIMNIVALKKDPKRPFLQWDFDTDKYDYVEIEGLFEKIDGWIKDRRLIVLGSTEFENIEKSVKHLKKEFDGPLLMFLDYFQIMPSPEGARGDGWQLIKEAAKQIANITLENEVITFSASQANDQGKAREGRDIFFYSYNFLELFNHSDQTLEGTSQGNRHQLIEKDDKQAILSLYCEKSRNFGQFYNLQECFRLDRYGALITEVKEPEVTNYYQEPSNET